MKKQDFIDYQKQNNLTLTELARKIGLHPRTLWMFLYSNSKRRRDVMYKLKDFYNNYILVGKQLELLEPVKNEDVQEEVKVETPVEEEENREECDDDDDCCEECFNAIPFREFMIGLKTALVTLKSQGDITEDTFDSLCIYISGIERTYNDALEG
jgi:transcriptional regulator with XRE-family HTH domain